MRPVLQVCEVGDELWGLEEFRGLVGEVEEVVGRGEGLDEL